METTILFSEAVVAVVEDCIDQLAVLSAITPSDSKPSSAAQVYHMHIILAICIESWDYPKRLPWKPPIQLCTYVAHSYILGTG